MYMYVILFPTCASTDVEVSCVKSNMKTELFVEGLAREASVAFFVVFFNFCPGDFFFINMMNIAGGLV